MLSGWMGGLVEAGGGVVVGGLGRVWEVLPVERHKFKTSAC